MTVSVTEATPDEASTVAALTAALLVELDGGDVAAKATLYEPIVADLLSSGIVWSLIARDSSGAPIGVLNLNECAAIYAGGRFGEITELYVTPPGRSAGTGRALISAATLFADRRGWSRLEVGAPPETEWQRTIHFYRTCGFEPVGPRLRLPKARFDPN